MKTEPNWTDLLDRVLNQIRDDVLAGDMTAIESLLNQLTVGAHPKRKVLQSYLSEATDESN